MGDTPEGSTWDRCVLLTTDLRHHSNNRQAMMMFQTVGHDVCPTLGAYACGVGFSAKCTLNPVKDRVASEGQKDFCTCCGDERAVFTGTWLLSLVMPSEK